MRSALMPELNGITKAQLVEPSPTAVLPTPPPGYRYAIGPRRGQYAVLQPVAVSEKLSPPPRCRRRRRSGCRRPSRCRRRCRRRCRPLPRRVAPRHRRRAQRPPPRYRRGAAAGRGGGPGGGLGHLRAAGAGSKPTGNGDRPGRRLIAEAANAAGGAGGAALRREGFLGAGSRGGVRLRRCAPAAGRTCRRLGCRCRRRRWRRRCPTWASCWRPRRPPRLRRGAPPSGAAPGQARRRRRPRRRPSTRRRSPPAGRPATWAPTRCRRTCRP